MRKIISATPFYSIPLHFIIELNYAFPALAPVFRALNKRSIDDNCGKIILILHINICCDPSSEPSCQDGSDEGSQHTFYAELIKSIPNYHQTLPLISVPSNAQAGSHNNVKILGNGHYSGRSRAA